MTERQLREIEERVGAMKREEELCAQDDKRWPDWHVATTFQESARDDIPALVAEVRRLKRHVGKCGAMIRSLKGDPWVLRGKYAKRFAEQARMAERGELPSYPCARPDTDVLRGIVEALTRGE